MITNYFKPLDNNYKDKHSDSKWKKINVNESKDSVDININFHEDKIINIPSHCSTELDFFKLIFTDELFENIAKGTNSYVDLCKKKFEEQMEIEKEEYLNENPDVEAQQKYLEDFENIRDKNTNMISKYSNVYVNDIEDYFAALIFMGLYRLPNYRDHWSNDILLGSPCKNIIGIWKFECLQKFIHTYPADSVGKNKILPLTKEILKNSRKYYIPSTFVSIDERIISFRGRDQNLVYEPLKPTKYGYFNIILSDNKSGFTYAQILLDDYNKETNDNANEGKMFNAVKQLMNFLPKKFLDKDKFILVCDGLYTSEELMGERDFFTLGAIRGNRIKGENKKDIISNINEGESVIYKKCIKGNESTLVKFHDNKQFYIISNYIKKIFQIRIKSWSTKYKNWIHKNIPNAVNEYRKNMKGVDISNQFISYYELNFRTVRWWKRIFNEHIDVAIINSLCLFKKSRNLNITQKTYRLNLIKAIMMKNHPFKFVNNVKLDNLHLIKADNSGSRHNCKYCSERKSYVTNKCPTSKYYCNKCKIFLCVDCFYNYHEKIFNS